MTRFDTSNVFPDDPSTTERPRYQHWWQEALRDIRETSIVTWAHKVVDARAFYDPRPSGDISRDKRKAWFKEACEMSYGRDVGATVGGWSIFECIAKSRMTYEQWLADPKRPSRDAEAVRHTLRELGNPNIPCSDREKWIRLGEKMLAGANA